MVLPLASFAVIVSGTLVAMPCGTACDTDSATEATVPFSVVGAEVVVPGCAVTLTVPDPVTLPCAFGCEYIVTINVSAPAGALTLTTQVMPAEDEEQPLEEAERFAVMELPAGPLALDEESLMVTDWLADGAVKFGCRSAGVPFGGTRMLNATVARPGADDGAADGATNGAAPPEQAAKTAAEATVERMASGLFKVVSIAWLGVSSARPTLPSRWLLGPGIGNAMGPKDHEPVPSSEIHKTLSRQSSEAEKSRLPALKVAW